MARKGITEEEVATAITALHEAGLTEPSVRMIHQKLGKGSLTTIVKHKREIETRKRIADPTRLPDPIMTTINEAVESIWNELTEAAESAIASEAVKAKDEIEKLRVSMEESKKAERFANSEYRTIDSELSKANETIRLLESDNKTLRKNYDKTTSESQQLVVASKQLKATTVSQSKHIKSLQEASVRTAAIVERERKELIAGRDRAEKQLTTIQNAMDAKNTAVEELQTNIQSLMREVAEQKDINIKLRRENKASTNSIQSELREALKRAGQLATKQKGRSNKISSTTRSISNTQKAKAKKKAVTTS